MYSAVKLSNLFSRIYRLPNNGRSIQTAAKIAAVQPDTETRMIEVRWEDGKIGNFPYVWLRDCAPLVAQNQQHHQPNNKNNLHEKQSKPDPKCPITAATRTLTLNELNLKVQPEKLALDPEGDGILIRWPPYHEVAYKSDWLRDHLLTSPQLSIMQQSAVPWSRADLLENTNLPRITSEELCSADTNLLRQKIQEFAKYGLLLVKGGGAGDMQSLRALGYHIDELEPNKFRAYPHHVQGIHTGGAYKYIVPPICLLFIRQQPDDSTIQIVDGYRVGQLLREEQPSIFSFLCNTLIEYNVISKSGKLKSHKWPLFTASAKGDVKQVVFNNALRSPRVDLPPDALENYYTALKKFNYYCYHNSNLVNLRVEKGDLILIANQRILHGNTAYAENVDNWVDEIFLSDEPLIQRLRQ